jgi:uncharacterized DUF497 family protein
MDYEWDENKLTLNLKNHKVHFVMAEWFEWESALIESDQRKANRREVNEYVSKTDTAH